MAKQLSPLKLIKKMRGLSIADIERSTDDVSLWAVNTNPEVIHVFEVRLSDREPVAIRLEATWMPQNLIDYLPKSEITRSKGFRDSLRGNTITGNDPPIKILTEEDANILLTHPDADYERHRIALNNRERRSMQDNMTSAKQNDLTEAEGGKARKRVISKPVTTVTPSMDAEAPAARPIINNLVSQFVRGVIQETQLYDSVKMESKNLTEGDLRLLAQEGSSKVKKYATKKLAEAA